MCIHFIPTRNNTWVKQRLGVDLPTGNFPEETYPGYAAPLVLKSHQTGRMACGLAKFGLIPGWAKDEKISRHTYNARSESVAVKPSYRFAWRQRRYGIVLLDHFFEPNYVTGKAQQWRIALASQEPFGIASIYEAWLCADTPNAAAMMNWHHMPALQSHENSQKHV